MYLDHPKITATNSETEPDRLERGNRVYGYVVGVADRAGNEGFIGKLARIHDHKGTLIVTWNTPPTEEEKDYFVQAWNSLIGDETTHVTHELAGHG